MKVRITLLAFALLFVVRISHGQQLPYLNNVSGRCRVTHDTTTGFYTYKIAVTNGLSSLGNIRQFSVDILRGGGTVTYDTIGLKFVDQWTQSSFQSDYAHLVGQIIPVGFAAAPMFWDGLLGAQGTASFGGDGRNDIPPGITLDSFQLMSKAPPGIKNFTADPYIDVNALYPSLDDVNDPDSLITKMRQDEQAVEFHGKSVGPIALSSPFDSLKFLDTLKSYSIQSLSLGWIGSQITVNKYNALFDSTKAQIQRGAGEFARISLDSVIANANRDSSSAITSEAYALLRYNSEYLKKHLPTVSVTNALLTGWNMVSVPVEVSDFHKATLYPSSLSSVFSYNGSYHVTDPLSNGPGYWIKMGTNPGSVNYTGLRIDSLQIPLITGWNLIGSVSHDVPKTKIITVGTSVISNYFGYSGGGYSIVDTIKAGKGYWVKVNQNGSLILGSGGASTIPPITQDQPPPPAGAPATPSPLSPDNGTTGVSLSPTLSWNPDDNTTSNRLQVSTSSSFSTTVFDQAGITTTSQQVSGLSYSTLYYWRIDASNSFGESNWSDIWNFTTQDAPPSPCDCCVTSAMTLDQFTVTDANGNSQKLFVRNANRELKMGFTDVEMPPMPLPGIFHARFQSGKFIEEVKPNQSAISFPIVLMNATFPIKITWSKRPENNTQYWLVSQGGTQNRTALSGSGSMLINSAGTGTIVLQATSQPPPCQQ